jgi:hypothetical protein
MWHVAAPTPFELRPYPGSGAGRGVQIRRVLLLAVCAFCLLHLQGCFFKNQAEITRQYQEESSRPLMGAAPVKATGTAYYMGKKRPLREMTGRDTGYAVPDGAGGMLWVPSPAGEPGAEYMDARELRLKMRELADQLMTGVKGQGLECTVVLPVSFVSQDDFTQTSSFGRFAAEQLLYEFNQRGVPVREYRMAGSVTMNNNGEFLLSRAVAPISAQNPDTVFVVGTYYMDRQVIFVNARLVRGSGGEILRTGQLVLAPNAMTKRMMSGGGKKLHTGALDIRDYKNATQPTNLTPIDLGADIH